MRVLFLQRQPCIRALKYAHALTAGDMDITLGFAYQGQTLTEWYGAGDELFAEWWRLPARDPEPALSEVVERFAPDIIHSHNLPDALTVAAIAVAGGRVPVIHDSHDMQSLRQTPYEDGFDDPGDPVGLEAAAVEGCSALIAVSAEMLEAMAARHRLPERTILFPNYALARDLAPDVPVVPRASGPLRVVYQGSVSVNGSHYDLRDQLVALARSGASVDIYPNRDASAYRDLARHTPGLRLMRTLPPDELMRRLPQYDIGWAAFNASVNAAHLDTALPNKAFEYLASGLPVAAGRHRALARVVEELQVGVVIDDPGELVDRLRPPELAALRRRVSTLRHRFTVEGQIDRLVDLYAQTARTRVGA